ncbi:MAG: 8-hydroxy-5-deazaflavin:NADPH oxidoreductase [Actinomycetota bacterium]|nr:8-hydroxy-5-deazaflavin:NADPH oxidoreductase [Actinomycetota bacterium]
MAKVTIIGAGNMARGIGTRLLAGGHQVQFLAPTAEHATALAKDLGGHNGSVSAGRPDEEIAGEVVVLATPYDGAVEFAQNNAQKLNGKVVVDITNPVDYATFDGLVTPPDSSAAQEIAKRLPAGVPVVKAFNTTFAGTLTAGGVAGQDLDVLIAGDDEGAKKKVADLVASSGLRPVDAGPLRRAQQLEHLGFLHMALQQSLGTGFGSAVKFVGP